MVFRGYGLSVTVLVVGVALLTGCSASGHGGVDATVAGTVRSFFQAIDRHDGRAACAALAPRAAEGLETGDTTCDREITTLRLSGGPISHVQVWGNRAQLRAGHDTVFLADFGDLGWKITAAGCSGHKGRPYDCEIEA